jgi:dihydrodipicolinate synthase/N-acetylneuraminate lyase
MRGAYPALITPFTENGISVALDKIGPIVERHIQKGVSGLFICGTTGQGPNLTAEEKINVIKEVMDAAAGRFEVWAQVTCDDWPGTLKTIDAALKTDVTGLSFLQPWYYGVDVVEMLRLGIEANVTSFGNAVPDYFVHIHNAAKAGDWNEANIWQEKLNCLVDAWADSVLISRFHEAYRILGIETGCVRPPLRELNNDERANVKEWIDKEGIQ